MRDKPDLNLLFALEALLDECSVTGAAKRLHLSVSATSHILDRIRKQFDDPILVRSGRGLVPTQRAESMHERLTQVLHEARALSLGDPLVDPTNLRRDFMIVASEAVLSFLAGPLVAFMQERAPHVRPAFIVERHELLVRNPAIDLIIGAIRDREPGVQVETILTDRLVGVCRKDHPLLQSRVTMERYLAARHIVNSRQGHFDSPLDTEMGVHRAVVASAPIAMSLWVLLSTDLVGLCYERMEGPAVAALGLQTFEVPQEHEAVDISQAWHPRFDGDPAHAWLRASIHEVVDRLLEDDQTPG